MHRFGIKSAIKMMADKKKINLQINLLDTGDDMPCFVFVTASQVIFDTALWLLLTIYLSFFLFTGLC